MFIFCFWNGQEPEVEYVEGYDELEEEEDIEDFGGFATHRSPGNYVMKKMVKFSLEALEHALTIFDMFK